MYAYSIASSVYQVNLDLCDQSYSCFCDLPEGDDYQLIDVRPPAMQADSPLEGALHIPLLQLRSRLNEIGQLKPVIMICKFGKLSYSTARILRQHGYAVKSVSDGV